MTMKLTRTRVALAVAALGIAVAGASYAAIPAANGTISGCKDSKGSLKVIDAEAGQTCNSSQQLLTWNQQGPQGPAGAAGPAGPQGPAGISGYEAVSGNPVWVGSGSNAGAYAECPPGKMPVGGGAIVSLGAPNTFVAITASYAYVFSRRWYVVAHEMAPTSTNWSVQAQAICATVN